MFWFIKRELTEELYKNEIWVSNAYMQLWKCGIMCMHLFMKDKILILGIDGISVI